MGQTKGSPWSSRLVVLIDTPKRTNLLMGNHGGGYEPHRVVVPANNVNSHTKILHYTDIYQAF
jgi:hypothetical protein